MSDARSTNPPVATSPARERDLTRRDGSDALAGARHLTEQSDVGIVLTWLSRLRWFAVAGQSGAVAIAVLVLDLKLPWAWLVAVMAVTVFTNLVLYVGLRERREWPSWTVPGLLLLDVVLLTLLLAATGGPQNPFCELYLIHVAMSVVAVPPRSTWIIAGVTVVSFALLFAWHRPLSEDPLPAWTFAVGNGTAMAISAGLIVYFLGHVRQTLRRRERQIADMQRRMEQGARLAGLSTLAAGAAHELGTPLGTIAVVTRELERILADASLPSTVHADLRLIREQVDRCRRTLDRMNVERLADQASHAEPCQLDALLAAVVAELQPGRAERLSVTRPERMNTLQVPFAATVQALVILVQNAFDASAPNGRVRLSVGTHGGQVSFDVRDEGEGIAEALLDRLGEPFVTSKSPSEGMGLGLFLARSLAESLGGRLLLKSAPGQGTNAILELPPQANEQH